jgi:hypothetical protein
MIFYKNSFKLMTLLIVVFATGCASVAPNYSALVDNVEILKNSGASKSSVGSVAVAPSVKGASIISIRASNMSSSVGANYGDYIANALKQELELARLYGATSPTQISGQLLANDIAAGGLSTNSGEIELRLIITASGVTKYDSVKRITHSWESSFAGAIAIPKAQQQYPIMVQMVIAAFLKDTAFLSALK